MTEQDPPSIGTVAQEAARLIEDMASMARSSSRSEGTSNPYARGRGGAHEPAHGPASPEAPRAPRRDHVPGPSGAGAFEMAGDGLCSACGSERDSTPASCRLCPVCRGIGLLRSVRPETVDLLADLAMSVAGTLRDVATRARASDPASSARSSPGSRKSADCSSVQDIPVDDESDA